MKPNDTKKRPIGLIIAISVAGLIVLLAGGFVGWALLAAPAGAMAMDALASDEQVTVVQDQWLVFQPKTAASVDSGTAGSTGTDPSTATGSIGFIFYPGARVDYHAYAPLVRPIAQAGYLAVIVPMPLNLAMFDLAREYNQEGMAAYARLQDQEFDRQHRYGYAAVKHQRFVGTGYFDEVAQTIARGKSSTLALKGSTEEQQFEEVA